MGVAILVNKNQIMRMERSGFLKFLIVTPLVLFSKACFSSPQSGLDDDQKGTNSRRVFLSEITSNHGHLEIDLTPDDIETNSRDTFLLTGGGHRHQFSLDQLQIQSLLDGEEIFIIVTGNYHSHTLTIYYSPEAIDEGSNND